MLYRKRSQLINPNALIGLNPIRALGFVARAASAIRLGAFLTRHSGLWRGGQVPDLESDVARSRSKTESSYHSSHLMTIERDPPVTNSYANDTRDIWPIILIDRQLHR